MKSEKKKNCDNGRIPSFSGGIFCFYMFQLCKLLARKIGILVFFRKVLIGGLENWEL